MKKLFKITSLILAGLLFVSLIFGAGVYASQNWLNFTGDEQIEQSEADVNEILEILEEVAGRGDMTAEELATAKDRIQELEDMNPSGLAKLNKQLREENEQLKNDKAILSTDLNAKKKEIDEKNIAYDNLQNERDTIATARDNAIAERDNLQVQLDDETRVHGELKDEYNITLNLLNEERQLLNEQRQKNTDLSHDVMNLREMYEQANIAKEEGEAHIEHLEKELKRANEKVATHAQNTNTAVEEARKYKVVDQE